MTMKPFISKHASYDEVTRSRTAEQHGIHNTPNAEQLLNLRALAEKVFEPVRLHIGAPIRITSGFRHPDVNARIPGASTTSQHCRGEAFDLVREGRNADIFHFIRTKLKFDQLIWEHGNAQQPDWVHVSYRRTGPNRQQLLRARRVGKRTVYEPWKP